VSAVAQGLVLGRRNIMRSMRNPASVSGAVIAPAIFLLGFLAVLGRMMDAQGFDYVQYLTPAIVVQATLFAAMSSGYYVAEDAFTGMLSRARSMPIARSAPVIGRSCSDATRAVVGLVVLCGLGTVFGFRFEGGIAGAVGFWVLAVAIAVTLSLGTGLVGLKIRDPRTTLEVLNMPYLPLLMISTAFVPAERFPSWLEGFVAHQPVSRFAEALRTLSSPDPFGRPVLWAVLWVVGLGLVFGLANIRAYGRPA
jgi:ABC-2 type transport system permease protein